MVLLVLFLAGCHWLASAPEARARELVEVLILDPTNRDRAVALAGVADETALAKLLSSEIEIEFTYLRARVKQGASVRVSIESVERLADHERRVRLAATVSGPHAAFELGGREKDKDHYELLLVQSANAPWQVRDIRPLE